ncbi:MAG: universal stress protein [Vicinamibacterales bacterium]|nr:universal stress protein [Vicinamibacterales bacterium]
MFDRVLVPIDGAPRSRDAIAVGRRLARLHGARLWLVTVATPDVDDAAAELVVQDGLRAAADPGAVTTIVRGADAAEEIVRIDRAHPGALVCMATRARGAIGRTLFGSVAHGIIGRSNLGQVLVGPACDLADRPIDRIIVCLDGSPEGEDALAHGVRWSESTGTPLILVRVVYPLVDPVARIPPTDAQMSELGYARRLSAQLEAGGHPVSDVTVQHVFPPEALVDIAERWPTGLLVVASSNAGPAAEFVLGSTANRVVRASSVPVLVVPRG